MNRRRKKRREERRGLGTEEDAKEYWAAGVKWLLRAGSGEMSSGWLEL